MGFIIKPRRPVSRRFVMSNPFGRPGDYAAGVHTGTDFACPVGTPVYSPRAGEVIYVGHDARSYGHHVKVWNEPTQKVYLLAHLSRLDVKEGQIVRRGQQLGLSGDSGNSTGPHLHAEQRFPPFGYNQYENGGWR